MKLSVPLKTPAQKIKAALIPVLVLGLAWTLFSNEQDSSKPVTVAAEKAKPGIAGNNASPAKTKEWNELSLEEIVAFNPFPIPAPIPKQDPMEGTEKESPRKIAKAAEPIPSIKLWEMQRVSIVYQGPNGPLAVIGDETVGIGDMLDGNTRVVGIRGDGVWVSQETNASDSAAADQTGMSAGSQSGSGSWDWLSKIGKKFGF
jgi:hypothetical protein